MQARHCLPRLQHITLILLCITTFNALAGHPNTMSSGNWRRTQKVLHLYNCILLKKKKNLIAACWQGLSRETGDGYFSVDYLYSINNNSLSGDARKAMTNPASQEHSQRNKKHIVITPTNCTCQHSFYQHLIWLEYMALAKLVALLLIQGDGMAPHHAKHSLSLILNMIIRTSFFSPETHSDIFGQRFFEPSAAGEFKHALKSLMSCWHGLDDTFDTGVDHQD